MPTKLIVSICTAFFLSILAIGKCFGSSVDNVVLHENDFSPASVESVMIMKDSTGAVLSNATKSSQIQTEKADVRYVNVKGKEKSETKDTDSGDGFISWVSTYSSIVQIIVSIIALGIAVYSVISSNHKFQREQAARHKDQRKQENERLDDQKKRGEERAKDLLERDADRAEDRKKWKKELEEREIIRKVEGKEKMIHSFVSRFMTHFNSSRDKVEKQISKEYDQTILNWIKENGWDERADIKIKNDFGVAIYHRLNTYKVNKEFVWGILDYIYKYDTRIYVANITLNSWQYEKTFMDLIADDYFVRSYYGFVSKILKNKIDNLSEISDVINENKA
jgi:hypothetical protein